MLLDKGSNKKVFDTNGQTLFHYKCLGSFGSPTQNEHLATTKGDIATKNTASFDKNIFLFMLKPPLLLILQIIITLFDKNLLVFP